MRRISRVCWRVRLGELSGEARPLFSSGQSQKRAKVTARLEYTEYRRELCPDSVRALATRTAIALRHGNRR